MSIETPRACGLACSVLDVAAFVEGYKQATWILAEKHADLAMLAMGLLESETLTGEEMKDLLQGKPAVRRGVSAPPPEGHRPAFEMQG